MNRAPVSGYVLAGGLSSRMGRDKALLQLAGRPLALIAVEKLRTICSEVSILSSRSELAAFAPLVPDIHPNCGPLGGMETALLHSRAEWSLFLPVDMPFVPSLFLADWVNDVLVHDHIRIALFTVDGTAQPTLCMLHREVRPFLEHAVEQERLKLFPILQEAGIALASQLNASFETVFLDRNLEDARIFANLNTPEEFAEAERLGLGQW